MFYNNQFVPFDAKKCIHGIFTTLLVQDGQAFFLAEHIQRIKRHCQLAKILFSNIEHELLRKLIALNHAQKGPYRLRIIVDQKLLALTLEKETTLKNKITLCIYPIPSQFSPLKIKQLPYDNRKKLLKYAHEKKADDCLTIDHQGHILEGSIANVFWIKNGCFFYPDPNLSYFKGIVLDQAIAIAKDLKLNVQSGKFQIQDLDTSTLFYCNSIKGILPVQHLEGTHLNFNETVTNPFLELYRKRALSFAVHLIV